MNNDRAYGGESRAVRVERRRQAFLDAALEVFGTVGYRKATVKSLCRQAQLADRYFYESFDTLEDLLVAAYQAQVEGMRACLLAAHASVSPSASSLEMVEACLRALYTLVRDPRIARLVWLEVLGVSPRVDHLYAATLQDFATLLLSLSKSREPDWSLPPGTERMLGLSLVGAVSEAVQHWLIGGYADDVESLVDASLIVFEGVLQVLHRRHQPGQSAA